MVKIRMLTLFRLGLFGALKGWGQKYHTLTLLYVSIYVARNMKFGEKVLRYVKV